MEEYEGQTKKIIEKIEQERKAQVGYFHISPEGSGYIHFRNHDGLFPIINGKLITHFSGKEITGIDLYERYISADGKFTGCVSLKDAASGIENVPVVNDQLFTEFQGRAIRNCGGISVDKTEKDRHKFNAVLGFVDTPKGKGLGIVIQGQLIEQIEGKKILFSNGLFAQKNGFFLQAMLEEEKFFSNFLITVQKNGKVIITRTTDDLKE